MRFYAEIRSKMAEVSSRTLTAYPYRKQQISLSVCANAKADPDLCNNCRKMNNNNKV